MLQLPQDSEHLLQVWEEEEPGTHRQKKAQCLECLLSYSERLASTGWKKPPVMRLGGSRKKRSKSG